MIPSIANRFRVLRQLGKGGFGAVYEAEPVGHPGERVALKVLDRPPGDGEEFDARVMREVRNAQRLDHPHAVRVYDSGALPDGKLFYTMQLCAGRSIRDILNEAVRLEAPRAVRLVTQALSALGAAHALGMVHRDVKPENIQVVAQPGGLEHAMVLDFGLSKIGGRHSQELTADGQVFGTVEYMSPEQLTGRPLDGRSDLYSMAVVLFEAIAGARPHTSQGNERALIRSILLDPAPDLAAHTRGRVSPALGAAIAKALSKKPGDRYASADALIAALLAAEPAAASAEAGRAPAAPPPPANGNGNGNGARAAPGPTIAVPPPTRGVWALPHPPAPPPPAEPEPPPAPLGGRYVLRREVSASSHGKLFEGFDLIRQGPVAVKVVEGRGVLAEDDHHRYTHGIRALCCIAHRHVIALLDGGLGPRGNPYYVTEWVDGPTLAAELRRRGRAPLVHAAAIVCQLLEGLEAAHAAGCIHRDVTADHILLAPTEHGPEVKLFGFGIAKAVIDADTLVTRWGQPVGTPRYMAPEQLRGQTLDARADVFAAGVVLFEMLAGHPPFVGESAIEVARAMLVGPPPRLPDDIDLADRRAVEPVLARALARNRDERFGSAAELRIALAHLAVPAAPRERPS